MREWNHVFERFQLLEDRGKVHPLTKTLRITECTIHSILTFNEICTTRASFLSIENYVGTVGNGKITRRNCLVEFRERLSLSEVVFRGLSAVSLGTY